MKQSIEAAFPIIKKNKCLEMVDAIEFWIFDSNLEKRCFIQISPNEEEKQFKVLNPSGNSISFLAIDKCVFLDDDSIKRCDFAIYDDMSFYFVEIKIVKAKNRKSERFDMYLQLASTIENFINKDVDFGNRKILAILSFPKGSLTYPLFQSRSMEKTIEFLDNYNAILLEGNEITFS